MLFFMESSTWCLEDKHIFYAYFINQWLKLVFTFNHLWPKCLSMVSVICDCPIDHTIAYPTISQFIFGTLYIFMSMNRPVSQMQATLAACN